MPVRKVRILGILIIVVFVIFWEYFQMYRNEIAKQDIDFSSNTHIKWDLLIRHIQPPFPYKRARNMSKMYSQAKQDHIVYELFPKQNGFFIEMGAFDGITFSNTLWLERYHNWTGLLIEANPDLCKAIDSLQRRAWRLCGCISEMSSTVFIKGGSIGAIADTVDTDHLKQVESNLKVTVPCFKLQHILKTLQQKHIDYFSLDVEGGEMFVLNSIRDELKFRMITVDVWTIEYRVINEKEQIIVNKSKHNLELLRAYFREVGGYVEYSLLSNTPLFSNDTALDVVFINVEAWCKRHLTVLGTAPCKM